MDGWALRAADVGPPLRVVGESAAGQAPSAPLRPGEAVRISTGALLPSGADAVLRREDGAELDGWLSSPCAPRPWTDVRRRGDDLRQGRSCCPRGRGWRPTRSRSWRPPATPARSVAGVCGWPSAPPVTSSSRRGTVPADGGAVESNLVGLVAQAGPAVRSAVRDRARRRRPAATCATLAGLLDAAPDVLVTVGGICGGAHDHVGPALESLGTRWDLRGVAMRPGHPVGMAGGAPPSSSRSPAIPAAAAVCFHLLGRALLGARDDWSHAMPLAAPVPRHPRDGLRALHDGARGLLPLGAAGSRAGDVPRRRAGARADRPEPGSFPRPARCPSASCHRGPAGGGPRGPAGVVAGCGARIRRRRTARKAVSGLPTPRARLELATLRLTAGCSTIELPRNAQRSALSDSAPGDSSGWSSSRRDEPVQMDHGPRLVGAPGVARPRSARAPSRPP